MCPSCGVAARSFILQRSSPSRELLCPWSCMQSRSPCTIRIKILQAHRQKSSSMQLSRQDRSHSTQRVRVSHGFAFLAASIVSGEASLGRHAAHQHACTASTAPVQQDLEKGRGQNPVVQRTALHSLRAGKRNQGTPPSGRSALRQRLE